MKIAVNALRLAGQRFGIGRYLEALIRDWNGMVTPSESVSLFTRDPVSVEDLHLSSAFSLHQVGPAINGTLWENFVLPRHCSKHDVLFGPSYTVPFTYRGRSVVATHSVNEKLSDAHDWWYRCTHTPLNRMCAKKADRVIVPSLSTKQDVQEYYGINADKIDVVAEGADDLFRPIDDQELLRQTRIKYLGVDCPYILFVGKMSQRRNIPSLLRAFARLKKRDKIPHKVLLFGPNHLKLPLREIAAAEGITDDVIQTDGKVSHHSELLPIYNAADLYVYPSSYDGFSLTLVEAMSCGLPVVTSKSSAIGEIANGYAQQVDDPSNVDELTDAIGRVLGDRTLWAELSAKSLLRSKAFRLKDTARGTLEVLRKVANG